MAAAQSTVLTRFGFQFDQGKLNSVMGGVKRTASSLNTVAARTQGFTQKIGGALGAVRNMLGAYVGFRGLQLLTTDFARGADEAAKFARGLGITIQEYQGMSHAAQLAGLTVQELNVALPNLAKRAGDAADGSKEAALAFRRAGVAIKENGKLKDPIRLMTDLADGMKQIQDPGRKTQILMNLFGRSGKKMGVLLEGGAAGIKKAMLEAEKLGIVLTKTQAKAAENFNDEMLRAKSVLTGVRNTIALKLLPTITKGLRAFQMWAREGRNMERMMRSLKFAAGVVGFILAKMITGAIIKQVVAFVRVTWLAVSALRAMGIAGAFAAIKVWLVVLAMAAIGLIVEDLVRFVQGHDSLIGRMLGDPKVSEDLRKSLMEFWTDAVAAWKKAKPALIEAWKALKPALIKLAKALKPFVDMWQKMSKKGFKVFIWALIQGMLQLADSLAVVASGVEILADVIDWAMANVNAAAEGVTNAWERAGIAIEDAIDDAKVAAMNAGLAMGIDMFTAADTADRAWTSAINSISKGIGTLTGKVKWLLGKIATITGNPLVAKLIGALTPSGGTQTDSVRGPAPRSLDSVLLPGPGGPAPLPGAAGAAGGAVNTTAVTNNVAPGAVQLTVKAEGDAVAIAAQMEPMVNKVINKVITDASRDIVRAPQGQS